MEKLINFMKDEEGATAVEYGIMIALISIMIIAAVAIIGRQSNWIFTEAHTMISQETNAPVD